MLRGLATTWCHPAHSFNEFTWNYPPINKHQHISTENATLLDIQAIHLFSSELLQTHKVYQKWKECQSRSPLVLRDSHPTKENWNGKGSLYLSHYTQVTFPSRNKTSHRLSSIDSLLQRSLLLHRDQKHWMSQRKETEAARTADVKSWGFWPQE